MNPHRKSPTIPRTVARVRTDIPIIYHQTGRGFRGTSIPWAAEAQQLPAIWRNRTFTTMFLAQAISLAGSGVTTVALALFVHQLAGPAAATVVLGQVLMLRIAAFLL